MLIKLYQAERHDFRPQLCLFFSPLHFPPKKNHEEEKENGLEKIMIKGHAILLDHQTTLK